jgi:hypothetical protein
MAGAHNPYHVEGTHGTVISTTAGVAIQNLEEVIRAKSPGWFEASPVSTEQLTQLGLSDYFDADGNIILAKLPEIYRRARIPVTGSTQLSAGSLSGLLRLLALEANPAEPSQNFKSFAIGVFLQCEAWDRALIHGVSCQIPLDKAFACVAYALADEVIYAPQKITKNFQDLFVQIQETNSPLLACSTGRRHDLVGVLGAAGYPGVLVFADDADFINQSVELFLKEKLEKLSRENPEIYQKILGALIRKPLMTLGGRVESIESIESTESIDPTGSSDAIGSIDLSDSLDPTGLSKILDLLCKASHSAPAGAGNGAGAGAAAGSSADTPFSEWIKELRAFVIARLGEVGLVKAEDDKSDKDVTAVLARSEYEKKLNDLLPASDLKAARSYLKRQCVPLGDAQKLAVLRIGYLFKTYPSSGAVNFIKAQNPEIMGPVALGEQASQLSEYLDLLKQMDHLGVITDEQVTVVTRLRAALSPLRSPTAGIEIICEILSPKFVEDNSADKALVIDLIREKSSGRNGFITNFFAFRSLAIANEDYEEGVNELTKHLKNLFAFKSPVTDRWIEDYQTRHREGVVLTLDPLTINLILLHALRTPISERTPAFSGALVEVIAFIRRSFAEAEGEVSGGLEQVLKRDSYPEDLLALVESGGGLMELYQIQDVCQLYAVINALKKSGLTAQIRTLLKAFIAQADVVAKIQNGYQLASVSNSLKEAGLVAEIRALLIAFIAQADVLAKIQNGAQLCYVINALNSAGLIDQIGTLLARPDVVAKIKNGDRLCDVIKTLNSAGLKGLIGTLLARPDVVAKIENGYELSGVIYALNSAGLKAEIKTLLAQPGVVAKIKNGYDLCWVINCLIELGLKAEIGTLLAQPGVVAKIKDVHQLCEVISRLNAAELTDEIGTLLARPDMVAIQNGGELLSVIRQLNAAELTDEIGALLARPDVVAKIENGDQLCDVIKTLNSAGLKGLIGTLLAQPDLVAKIHSCGDALVLVNGQVLNLL